MDTIILCTSPPPLQPHHHHFASEDANRLLLGRCVLVVIPPQCTFSMHLSGKSTGKFKYNGSQNSQTNSQMHSVSHFTNIAEFIFDSNYLTLESTNTVFQLP